MFLFLMRFSFYFGSKVGLMRKMHCLKFEG